MRPIGRLAVFLSLYVAVGPRLPAQESRATVLLNGYVREGAGFPFERTEVLILPHGWDRASSGADAPTRVTAAVGPDGFFSVKLAPVAWTLRWVPLGGAIDAAFGAVEVDLGGGHNMVRCEIVAAPAVRLVQVSDPSGAPIAGAIVGSGKIPRPAPNASRSESAPRPATDPALVPHHVSDQSGWAWPRQQLDLGAAPLAIWAEGYRPFVVARTAFTSRVHLVKGVPVRLRLPRWFAPPEGLTATLELDPTGPPEWWRHARVTLVGPLTPGPDANELLTSIPPGSYTPSIRVAVVGREGRVATVDLPGTIVIPESKVPVTIDIPVPEAQYTTAVERARR